MNAAKASWEELGRFYRDHLEQVVLPFWMRRAVDTEHGGVFTCIENATGRRVSSDKFVWSQARFAWLMGHAARMARRGALSGDAAAYEAHARKTCDFLARHAFLEDGSVAYLLSADGRKKEFLPGKGHDISFFADGFVILGMSETARATGDDAYLELALETYDRVRDRLAARAVRSEPYPMPDACRPHAWPMIMLNVAQELALALRDRGHPRADSVDGDAVKDMDEVLTTFVRDDGLVQEVICADAPSRLLTRHVTPGHAIESMWFVMEQAVRHERFDAVETAVRVVRASFEAGWDGVHGGLFRFVIPGEAGPSGPAEGPFERLILDTWDTKIWWPHSETLYATALGSILTDDAALRDLHDRTHAYTFATFPHPDPAIGEWIQIRDREGRPIDKVVGLPVKDPYHVIRNLMLLVELLSEGVQARTTGA